MDNPEDYASGSSQLARDVADALGLPPVIRSLTLRLEAGELAKVEAEVYGDGRKIESYPKNADLSKVELVLKKYKIQLVEQES